MLKFLRAFCVYFILLCSIINSYIIIKFNNFYYKYLSFSKIDKKTLKNYNMKIFVNIINFYMNLLFWIKIKIDSEKINLDKKKYVFIINHISYLDLFIGMKIYKEKFLPPEKCFLIGIQFLFKIPLFGYVMKNINYLPIKVIRNSDIHTYSKKNVINLYNNIYTELNNNNSVVICPEGRINENPKIMKPIHNGAFNISKKMNIPIKIIAIKGIKHIWRKGEHPTGKGVIHIKIFNKEYHFNNKNEYQITFRTLIENYVSNTILSKY